MGSGTKTTLQDARNLHGLFQSLYFVSFLGTIYLMLGDKFPDNYLLSILYIFACGLIPCFLFNILSNGSPKTALFIVTLVCAAMALTIAYWNQPQRMIWAAWCGAIYGSCYTVSRVTQRVMMGLSGKSSLKAGSSRQNRKREYD